MSLALIKKKFKKELKSQIFILGSNGAGKSTLLKLLQQQLSMKHKGSQNIAGIPLETIKSNTEEIYAYIYDKSTFKTVSNFIHQPTTKCVIFVIDSIKKNIISDSNGNDIRSSIKSIAKVIPPNCHIIIICNKQDILNQDVLSTDEIGRILDIERVFATNPHTIFGCSLTNNTNTASIVSYLTDNHIIKPTYNDEEEKTQPVERKRRRTLKDVFKKRKKGQKVKRNELVLIFGLDQVGKTSLMDSFGFGKKTKTNIAIFEAETIKYKNVHTTEFHAWNYEQRSWPMAKSFFVNCSLVIFVIDATKYEALTSDKKNIWTVDKYIQKLLGIGANKSKPFTLNKSGIAKLPVNPLQKAKSVSTYLYDDDDEEELKDPTDLWPLKCPFLFYINKCDDENAKITVDDLEKDLQLSAIMSYKGIKYHVQRCSAKTKEGVYDGLIWCYNNEILTDIQEIKAFAQQNDIEIPATPVGFTPPPAVPLQSSKSMI